LRWVVSGARQWVDKSWGGDMSATVRIRTNDTHPERAAARARAREARAAEQASAMTQRLEARAIAREAEAVAGEAARAARRESEQQAVAADPHAAAAKRHRSSGRNDVVREQRDTTSYKTVVDERRIRELAHRGASVSGLAAAFSISTAEVERVLNGAE
jgi:hypothetical protein